MLIDIDTLAAVQNERYRDFVREAETLRLMRMLQTECKSRARVLKGSRLCTSCSS